MKKITFLFLTSLLIFSVGCSKDDDNVSVRESSISLYYEDTYQLTATGSNRIQWSSDDEFVAKVSRNGLVTANHVGTTYIRASSRPSDPKCRVTVAPKYNFYKEPIADWTLTKSDIIRKLGTPDSDDGNTISYKGDDVALLDMYIFGDNGKLESSTVAFRFSQLSNVLYFLQERHQPVAVIRPYSAMFINAMTRDEATLWVATQGSFSDGICIAMYGNIANLSKTRTYNEGGIMDNVIKIYKELGL